MLDEPKMKVIPHRLDMVLSRKPERGISTIAGLLERPLINIGTCYRTSGGSFLDKETGFQGIA
jgi:hypothetical protein